MALLVEATFDGTLYRISNEALALDHYWDPYVSKAGSIKWVAASDHGGYVSIKFSDLSFIPKLFEDSWPAPDTVDLVVKYTDSNEASAVTLFEGSSHTSGLDRQSNDYDVFGEDYDTTVTDEVFNDTLVNIFTTYTGGSYLNLTLDTTAARSPSPAVKYTASDENVLVNVLSDIAKFFSHSFEIRGSTLYLVDLLADNGTQSLTEFDFKPAQYRDPEPISLLSGGGFSVTGSSPYGSQVDISPVCHDTQSNIEDALDNILTIKESRGVELAIPMETSKVPVVGQGNTWLDESFDQDLNANMRTHGIVYNFDSYEFVITGRGTLS